MIEYVILALSLVAAILSIADFFKGFIKYKAIILVLTALLSISVVYQFKQMRDGIASEVATIEMQRSAKVVADSILISGWEETGDYLGYMGQITGFYKRYQKQYPIELELYMKELSGWRDYFEEKRKSGERFSTLDIKELKGLVQSAEEHLENIAKGKNS